jgi:hypothetical protein
LIKKHSAAIPEKFGVYMAVILTELFGVWIILLA